MRSAQPASPSKRANHLSLTMINWKTCKWPNCTPCQPLLTKVSLLSHNIKYGAQQAIFNLLKANAEDVCEHVCVPEFNFLPPKLNSFDQRNQGWGWGGLKKNKALSYFHLSAWVQICVNKTFSSIKPAFSDQSIPKNLLKMTEIWNRSSVFHVSRKHYRFLLNPSQRWSVTGCKPTDPAPLSRDHSHFRRKPPPTQLF